MNIPLVFSFCYLICGMITTAVLWSEMSVEIEMPLDHQGVSLDGLAPGPKGPLGGPGGQETGVHDGGIPFGIPAVMNETIKA
jgi:hypothetical protein